MNKFCVIHLRCGAARSVAPRADARGVTPMLSPPAVSRGAVLGARVLRGMVRIAASVAAHRRAGGRQQLVQGRRGPRRVLLLARFGAAGRSHGRFAGRARQAVPLPGGAHHAAVAGPEVRVGVRAVVVDLVHGGAEYRVLRRC